MLVVLGAIERNCLAGDGSRRVISNGLATWSADFTQTIDDGHGKVMRSAAGKLYLQKPGRFRWDYSQPSEQLILADGKQIWFYDKDLQQANVRDMDASLANTPAVLLSGNGSVSSQFDVTALPPSDGLEWYQLIPKHAGFRFPAGAHRVSQGRACFHVSWPTSSIRSHS